jgi:hypothetical protein
MNTSNIINRGLLLFWSLWFSLVLGSNVVDGLQAAGVVPEEWAFSSGNFGFIADTIAIYEWPSAVAAVLFLGVVLIQLATCVLFWRAVRETGRSGDGGHSAALPAFGAGIGLFAGFLVADEFFIVYDRIPDLESTHFLVFCALLLSLVVMRLLQRKET